MPPSRQPVAAKKSPKAQAPSPTLVRKARALALLWGVVAIVYGGLAWHYGVRQVMMVAYSEAVFDRHDYWEVMAFAIGFGLVAAGALCCAVGALLNRWYYREFHMDKIWMVAALLATLTFPAPLFMPDSMKPRLGAARMFSLFGLVEVGQVFALIFLAAVLAVPLQKREADEG